MRKSSIKIAVWKVLLLGVILIIPPLYQTTVKADQTGPIILDVDYTPKHPFWDSWINISARVSDVDGLSYVRLQWCIGVMCYPPVDMMHSRGDMFWYNVSGPFTNGTVTFDILSQDNDGNPSTYGFNVTFRPRPTELLLNAMLSPDTLYPGENFTITGNITLNTGLPPQDGRIKVYQNNTILISTPTDIYGGFNITLKAPNVVGNYTYWVKGEGEGLNATKEFSLRVLEKPIPDLKIQLIFSGKSRREGGIYLFSEDKYVSEIVVSNIGLASVTNFTISVYKDGVEVLNKTINITIVSPLEPTGIKKWVGNVSFRSGDVGRHTVFTTITSPSEEIDFTNNYFYLNYTVIPLPSNRTQKVLIELFTSRTCEPCISSEQALDALRHLRADNATILSYVEDAASAPYLLGEISHYDITGTPTVIFDGGYRVKVGSGKTDELLTTYQTYLNESLQRYRPPVNLLINITSFSNEVLNGFKVEVNPGDIQGDLNGVSLTVYGVVPYLGPRGFNNAPIRYSISYYEVKGNISLNPGENLTFNFPVHWVFDDDGMVLVAALRNSDGKVITHQRVEEIKKPLFYVKHLPDELDVPILGNNKLTITIEQFRYWWEETTFPLSISIDITGASLGGFLIHAPTDVVIGEGNITKQEWGGKFKAYSVNIDIEFSASDNPSKTTATIALDAYNTYAWERYYDIILLPTSGNVILLRSNVGRNEDYIVITASFTNMSSRYTVQVEYQFYDESPIGNTRFEFMRRSPNGYTIDIEPDGEYKKVRYRLLVRDPQAGKIVYQSDWIDVKVPPGQGEISEGSNIKSIVTGTIISVILVLMAYLYIARRRKSLMGGEE